MSQQGFGAIPGASQQQLDQVAAIRAACQAVGPVRDRASVQPHADRVLRWLRAARDDADREVRRQILLAVTDGATATSDRGEPDRLMKLAEELYDHVHL